MADQPTKQNISYAELEPIFSEVEQHIVMPLINRFVGLSGFAEQVLLGIAHFVRDELAKDPTTDVEALVAGELKSLLDRVQLPALVKYLAGFWITPLAERAVKWAASEWAKLHGDDGKAAAQ